MRQKSQMIGTMRRTTSGLFLYLNQFALSVINQSQLELLHTINRIFYFEQVSKP